MRNSNAFVAYYRKTQQERVLSIADQKRAIAIYLRAKRAALAGEFTEVEGGRRYARPKLAHALSRAREAGATLLVAEMGSLSSDEQFLAQIRSAGVGVGSCEAWARWVVRHRSPSSRE
jgi:DNA invertase Pin-like site-specific DNA recombinase